MMNPTEYGRAFDGRVSSLVKAAQSIPAFAARLEAAGLSGSDIESVERLDRLPVLSKDELLDLQTAAPPFGGLLADGSRPRRFFQSPGPLYEPELAASDHWRWAPALRAAGFRPDDVVMVAFGYNLSPAGAMFEDGAAAVGCTVIPAGIGNMDLQVRAAVDLRASAFVGLPSYLNAMFEKADELDLRLTFEKAFVTAEPLPPALRDQLEMRVATIRQGYGTAEAGNLGFECSEKSGLHVPDDALVQVVDIATGEALWDGREGEVVVTLLEADYPLVRFGTGDLSAFLGDDCPCGLSTPRLAGWLGRVGDAVKVRGMFLHPRQATSALQGLSGVAAFRFVVDREDHRDELVCEVVPAVTPADPSLAGAVVDSVRSALRFNVRVEFVEELAPDTPVIDDRRNWD